MRNGKVYFLFSPRLRDRRGDKIMFAALPLKSENVTRHGRF